MLASYSGGHIYLFDTANEDDTKYSQVYCGHSNNETIKGVNFFGPRSEFIVSGSDCGNIFFWDKKTESIVQFMPGDERGVVNVLETHPHIPLLATSGLDDDVKIFVPSNETPTLAEGLEKCVYKNTKRKALATGQIIIPPEVFMRGFTRRLQRIVQEPSRDWFDSSDSDTSSDSNSDLGAI